METQPMSYEVIPCYPTHREGHSAFYKGYHKNDNLPHLFVAICFVEQYHRPTSWGILYFCLKNSIFKGEFTRLLNLPIWVNLKINWPNPIDKEWYERMAEESSREEKNMFKENINSIEINVCNILWYLSEDFRKYLKKEGELE